MMQMIRLLIMMRPDESHLQAEVTLPPNNVSCNVSSYQLCQSTQRNDENKTR